MNFYREKNAKSIQNGVKLVPEMQELGDLLINKLKEKANHIEIIYDEKLRYEYLKKKNKLEKAKGMAEVEIRTFLAKRLSVDLLQLYKDLEKYYFEDTNKIDFDADLKLDLQELEYKNKLLEICEMLKCDNDKWVAFEEFRNLILGYMSLFGLNLKNIENEQIKVEEKEGNFYNGIIVIYKD